MLQNAPAPNTAVVDVTEATFDALVLNESAKRLVVIDLWAPWCGPCRTLGPTLESLAQEAKGRWLLAKINVDEEPRLAQAFQAQSIPLVVAVYDGRPITQFAGALPKQEVKNWLNKIFEALELPPLDGDLPTLPDDPASQEALYRQRLQEIPDDAGTLLALGRLLFSRGDHTEAVSLLERIPAAAPEFHAARATLALRDFLRPLEALGGPDEALQAFEAKPDDLELRHLAALAHALKGAYPASLALLVDDVAKAPNPEAKERAQKAAATVFEAAGRGDEAVEQLRRRLTRLLF